jgi:FkbM family methyltransferase
VMHVEYHTMHIRSLQREYKGTPVFDLSPTKKDMIGDFSHVLDSFYLWTDPEDKHVGNLCRIYGYWEVDVTLWMMQNLKPGWNCLDVGFNIGYFTEVMARIIGPEGKVTAFEPNRLFVEKYLEARELNDYSNVAEIIVHNFGLSNKSDDLSLIIPKENPGGAGVHQYDGTGLHEDYIASDANIKRLDSFFDEPVDFIKMDIEGHEPLAWEGFSQKVKDCPLMVIELGPYQPIEFLKELAENYTMDHINGIKRVKGERQTKCEEDISIDYILRYPHHLNVALKRKNV